VKKVDRKGGIELKRFPKEARIGKIILRYNRKIENHIAKHNVRIEEIVRCFESDYLLVRLAGRDWIVISKHPDTGRYLTIFLEQIRKLEFRLKTARDSTESEKRLYRKKVK